MRYQTFKTVKRLHNTDYVTMKKKYGSDVTLPKEIVAVDGTIITYWCVGYNYCEVQQLSFRFSY